MKGRLIYEMVNKFMDAFNMAIATEYGLDGPGIESRWGEIFRPPGAALGPTQPPVQ